MAAAYGAMRRAAFRATLTILSQLHAIVVTHTPLRLRRTLLGLACQTRAPDSITVTCDHDDEAIIDAVRAACDEFEIVVTLILRHRHDLSRPAQARNNAVRRLLADGAADDAALVFLDGDSVLAPNGLVGHEAAMRYADLVIAWRFEMSREQTDAFDEEALRSGSLPIAPTAEQWAELHLRHRRLVRQALLRRCNLTKQHKPKVLGANFGVTLNAYRTVNGHDETYEGWAQEDDDLGRRLHMSGHRVHVAARDILSFHQWHETRAPGVYKKASNVHRLSEPVAIRCEHGLENPLDQHDQRVMRLDPM